LPDAALDCRTDNTAHFSTGKSAQFWTGVDKDPLGRLAGDTNDEVEIEVRTEDHKAGRFRSGSNEQVGDLGAPLLTVFSERDISSGPHIIFPKAGLAHRGCLSS